MKNTIFFFLLLVSFHLSAQFVYPIKADSTLLTGCNSNELIIENHTRNVPGFLFNTGNGRTLFKRGVIKLNDSFYLIGGDTLRYNAWVQGGNRWGSIGKLGTLDSNHLGLYTNGQERMRWTNTGRLLIGTTTDNLKETVQLNGSMFATGYISNFLAPSGTNSGAIRLRWGTGDGVYLGFYYQANTNRRGYIGTGADGRPLVIQDDMGVSFRNSPIVTVGRNSPSAMPNYR